MNRPDLDAIEQSLNESFADGEPLVAEVRTLIAYARELEDRLEDSRTGHEGDKQFLNGRIKELEQDFVDAKETIKHLLGSLADADSYRVQAEHQMQKRISELEAGINK